MDLQWFILDGKGRDFSRMINVLIAWKSCPEGRKGLYQGRNKSATFDMHFLTLRTCTDTKVLRQSPIFNDICQRYSS